MYFTFDYNIAWDYECRVRGFGLGLGFGGREGKGRVERVGRSYESTDNFKSLKFKDTQSTRIN